MIKNLQSCFSYIYKSSHTELLTFKVCLLTYTITCFALLLSRDDEWFWRLATCKNYFFIGLTISQASNCMHIDRLNKEWLWPNMLTDIAKYCKSCHICGRAKTPPRYTNAPLAPLKPVPFEFGDRLHIRYVEHASLCRRTCHHYNSRRCRHTVCFCQAALKAKIRRLSKL